MKKWNLNTIKYFVFCLLGLVFMQCQPKPSEEQIKIDYKEIVKTLQSNSTKVAYLQGILSLDTEVREAERSMVAKFGWNSAEHKASINKVKDAEKINLEKIEAFLDVYGYPDKQSLKSNSVDAPYTIILQINDLEAKERNFRHMYSAYRNKDLPGGSLANYMHKMYELKMGERMQLKNPFTEKFELDTLIRSLKLDTLNLTK